MGFSATEGSTKSQTVQELTRGFTYTDERKKVVVVTTVEKAVVGKHLWTLRAEAVAKDGAEPVYSLNCTELGGRSYNGVKAYGHGTTWGLDQGVYASDCPKALLDRYLAITKGKRRGAAEKAAIARIRETLRKVAMLPSLKAGTILHRLPLQYTTQGTETVALDGSEAIEFKHVHRTKTRTTQQIVATYVSGPRRGQTFRFALDQWGTTPLAKGSLFSERGV